ncbi:hypothetical protein ACJX0J_006521, partial [Zea mays]
DSLITLKHIEQKRKVGATYHIDGNVPFHHKIYVLVILFEFVFCVVALFGTSFKTFKCVYIVWCIILIYTLVYLHDILRVVLYGVIYNQECYSATSIPITMFLIDDNYFIDIEVCDTIKMKHISELYAIGILTKIVFSFNTNSFPLHVHYNGWILELVHHHVKHFIAHFQLTTCLVTFSNNLHRIMFFTSPAPNIQYGAQQILGPNQISSPIMSFQLVSKATSNDELEQLLKVDYVLFLNGHFMDFCLASCEWDAKLDKTLWGFTIDKGAKVAQVHRWSTSVLLFLSGNMGGDIDTTKRLFIVLLRVHGDRFIFAGALIIMGEDTAKTSITRDTARVIPIIDLHI